MCEEEMVKIEIEMSPDVKELIEKVSKETGFTFEKIIQYSVANQIIEKAIRKIKNMGVAQFE